MNRLISALAAMALTSSTAALAQTSPSTQPSQSPPGASDSSPSMGTGSSKTLDSTGAAGSDSAMMTDAQANAWINKAVYSSDNQNLGEVSAIKRDQAGNVTELHADIGGFLGLGETRVKITPDQFQTAGDRIVLNMSAEQAKNLPQVSK